MRSSGRGDADSHGSHTGGGRGRTTVKSMAIAAADGRAIFLAASLLALSLPVGALETSGRIELEPRGFTQSPAHPGQNRHGLSLAVVPELYHEFDDGEQSVLFSPFLRLDTADDERTHFDVRELLYQRVFDTAELRIGIGRVFWGVTESYHLVDIVNQTDLVENIDREDKLGQPLVNLTFIRDWGVVDLFVLPGFREGHFRGEGRLARSRSFEYERATYESGAGRQRIERGPTGRRQSGISTLGAAHFHGTSREPRLLPECEDGRSALLTPCNPSTIVLAPRYEVVNRTSLDLQATRDAMLWKLEVLHESGQGDTWFAWVAGFEYSWFGINESGMDLGLLVEHLFDDRGRDAPHPLEDDLFAGMRLALNDENDTALLAGAIVDMEGDATNLTLEASRRVGDDWKVELETRIWTGVANDDPMAPLRDDDYLQLTLSRYF